MTGRTMRLVAFVFLLVALSGSVQAEEGGSCVTCHEKLGGALRHSVVEWRQSAHKESAACHDCHGGDPAKATKAESMAGVRALKAWEIPLMCARCHGDPRRMRPYKLPISQLEQYKASVHGLRVLKEHDGRAAVCTSCHGTHLILPKRDPRSLVYRTRVPETCARCHSDGKLMSAYGIPFNQYDEYRKSVHGRKLLEENQLGAPNCADCHGVHGATPPGVKEIPMVCGTCHGQTELHLLEGRHGAALAKYGEPQCVSCHNNHAVEKPNDRMFSGRMGVCRKCHEPGGDEAKLSAELEKMLPRAEFLITQTRRKIEYIEHFDIYAGDIRAKLEASSTALIASRDLQHTVDLEQVRGRLDEGNANANEIMRECDSRLRELMKRKQLLLGVAFFLLFTALLIWLKRLSFSE